MSNWTLAMWSDRKSCLIVANDVKKKREKETEAGNRC